MTKKRKGQRRLTLVSGGTKLGRFLLLFLTLVAAWFLTSLLPVSWGDASPQEFIVKLGSSISQVAEGLNQAGLIRSSGAFKLLVRQSSIQAGVYLLSPNMPSWQIASILTSGKAQRIVVTIPEGFTNKQIEALLQAKGLLAQEESLKETIQTVDLSSFSWLPKEARSFQLEGFLFPDTYFFSPLSAPEQMIEAMLNNFKHRTDTLSDRLANSSLSLTRLVILASLVEREGKTEDEMRKIASVLLNRLKIGMRLDVDATIRYALNKWEGPLTQEDLAVNSPYNTRRVKGLPPGPICNPGLRAIRAVLEAPETEFYYYLTDASGTTHFAKTLEEHNQQKTQYLR